MEADQVLQIIEILESIDTKLDWLPTIATWIVCHVGIIIPLVLVVASFWWFFRQFLVKYK